VLLLFTNYHLLDITLQFILPEDRAVEKASPSRVTIRAALDAYLESLRIKKRPTKTITGKTYELGLFTGFCKKVLHGRTRECGHTFLGFLIICGPKIMPSARSTIT
jgi:hypothetical protein